MKIIAKNLTVGACALVVSLGLCFVILAWSEPSQPAPNGNVAAPINTGSIAQTKAGDLSFKNGANAPYSIHMDGGSFALKNNAGLLKLVVGQDGNIGIGTTTPIYKLDLRSGSETSSFHLSPTNDNGLYLTSTGFSNAVLSAGNYFPGPGHQMKATNAAAWGLGGDNGFVGIYSNSGLTPGQEFLTKWRLTIGGNGDMGIGGEILQTTPNISDIFTGAAMVLRSGKMGIGTVNPVAKLDVKSGSVASSFHLSPTDSDNGGIYLTSGGASNGTLSAGASYKGSGGKWTARSTSAWMLGGDSNWTALWTNEGLTPGSEFTATPRLAVRGNGDIGFGGANAVDSPSIRITKVGDFSVDGKICFKNDCRNSWSSVGGAGSWTVSGNNIYNNNSGSIGIGTASPTPSLKLDVRGALGVFGAFGATGDSTLVGNTYVGGDLNAPNNVRSSCYWTGWVQKSPLEINLVCNEGYFMAGTGFKHNNGEDHTYQESVRIYCCKL